MQDVEPLLAGLGAQVRAQRLARGHALAELAREAGVSRRYLTDLEAGRANPSFVVLARLASALGTPLARLVDLPLRRRASRRVALLGLRGAGKSTVGRLLARRLEVPFVELDRRVEELAGLSLGELFDLHGSAGFQRFQAEALEGVLRQGEALVVAVGGSLVDDLALLERLLETCRSVWLAAAPEDHFARVLAQGDRRPMRDRPHAMEELRALLATRAPRYARAELRVDTHDRAPEECAARIVEALGLEC